MKIPPLSPLKETDLQIDPKQPVTGTTLLEAFRNLFTQVNPFFDSLNKLAAKGISFTDNMQAEVVTAPFTHGVAQLVALKTLSRAAGVLVLGANGEVAIGSSITMKQSTPGSPAAPLASVTIYFLDPAAAKVPVCLLLLPEGQQTA